ncbi:hypothetical protein PENTCL1PPCAC_9152, partial [Pristionchus entomophagus]
RRRPMRERRFWRGTSSRRRSPSTASATPSSTPDSPSRIRSTPVLECSICTSRRSRRRRPINERKGKKKWPKQVIPSLHCVGVLVRTSWRTSLSPSVSLMNVYN